MDQQTVKQMSKQERVQMSNHIPKRAKLRGSSTHGGHKQARAGWSCDDTQISAVPTKMLPGKYRVTIPGDAVRYVRKAK